MMNIFIKTAYWQSEVNSNVLRMNKLFRTTDYLIVLYRPMHICISFWKKEEKKTICVMTGQCMFKVEFYLELFIQQVFSLENRLAYLTKFNFFKKKSHLFFCFCLNYLFGNSLKNFVPLCFEYCNGWGLWVTICATFAILNLST